jgi:hypothetical protein
LLLSSKIGIPSGSRTPAESGTPLEEDLLPIRGEVTLRSVHSVPALHLAHYPWRDSTRQAIGGGQAHVTASRGRAKTRSDRSVASSVDSTIASGGLLAILPTAAASPAFRSLPNGAVNNAGCANTPARDRSTTGRPGPHSPRLRPPQQPDRRTHRQAPGSTAPHTCRPPSYATCRPWACAPGPSEDTFTRQTTALLFTYKVPRLRNDGP